MFVINNFKTSKFVLKMRFYEIVLLKLVLVHTISVLFEARYSRVHMQSGALSS